MTPSAMRWCFPVLGLATAAALVTYHSASGQQRPPQAAPAAAAKLDLGLKVDMEAVPKNVAAAIKAG
ncbi:MAG TPA: hypothetical protein VES94_05540, partial [Burkholderiales bacterium]|nr:hypothetical protein [Burkholderiales bacterium]